MNRVYTRTGETGFKIGKFIFFYSLIKGINEKHLIVYWPSEKSLGRRVLFVKKLKDEDEDDGTMALP